MATKLLGIGSVIFPALLLFVFAIAVVGGLVSEFVIEDPDADISPVEPGLLHAVCKVAMALGLVGSVGIMVAEMFHAANNPKFSAIESFGWMLALLALNIFFITTYWFAFMRLSPDAEDLRESKLEQNKS